MDAGEIGALIPIVAIIFGIGIAVVSVLSKHKEKLKRIELRHRERLSAMEKGLELPPELDEGIEKQEKSKPLLTGMILVGVGTSLYFALAEVAGDGVELFAAIPASIGVAYLIYHFLEGRKTPT